MKVLRGWGAVFLLWRARRHRQAAARWLDRERRSLEQSDQEIRRRQQFYMRARLELMKADLCEKRAKHVGAGENE